MKFYILFCLIFLTLSTACAQRKESAPKTERKSSVNKKNMQNTFKSVEVAEFEKIIQNKNIVRLDVRTVEEWQESHIANTLNIDVLQDDFAQKAVQTLPKKKTIALYCRSGRRSKKAAEILCQQGYKVVELNTGITGWLEAGKPVTK